MAITVHFTWDTIHTLDDGNKMNQKTAEMTKAGKLINREVDALGVPTSTFVDQASADEFVEFMKQFNPAKVEVKEV